MERISKELHDIIKKAHMAGQFSAGVDPSYSEALAYCENITIDSGADAQQEIDKLKAYNELLRESLGEYKRLDDCRIYYQNYENALEPGYVDALEVFHTETLPRVLAETPAQSLVEHNMRIARRVQEACAESVENRTSAYAVAMAALEYAAEGIRNLGLSEAIKDD